jgi:hypothetical protein
MSVFDTSRGTQWSFCLEVQGFPWVNTDGVAAWTGKFGAPYIELPGTLASRDFTFKWLADPQQPLRTGQGVPFELIDDGTDFIFQTWSKDYRGRSGYGRLGETLGAATTDTVLTAIPQGGAINLPNDSYVFIGGETCKIVSSAGALSRNITRAQFSTLRDRHPVYTSVRPAYTTSPTVFDNRIVTLWAGPVDPLTGSLDAAEVVPLWAGVIDSAAIKDERVVIDCEPITKQLEKAWPAILPSAVLGDRSYTTYLLPESYHLYVRFGVNGVSHRVPLGEYDAAGVFTALTAPVDQYTPVSMIQYLKWVQDSVIYFGDNDPQSPFNSASFTLRGNFSLSAIAVEDTNEIEIQAYYQASAPINNIRIRNVVLPPGEFVVRAGDVGKVLSTISPWSSYITAEATEIDITLDRPAYPFETNWTWDDGVTEVGYATIGKGDEFETIMFRGVTIDGSNPRKVTLNECTRGVGGTKPSVWGAEVDDRGRFQRVVPGAIVITQTMMISESPYDNNGIIDKLPVSSVLLHVLMSTADRDQNGDYDLLDGYKMGRAIPLRWIDINSFESLAARHTLPLLSAWWVYEQGKGKDALAEMMKMSGVYFTEKRFLDSDSVWQYGISLECIDLPVASMYSESFTDDEQVSRSKLTTTHNERLVINNTKIKPHVTAGGKVAKGDEVFVWDEWSIAEYGTSKVLEFKPTALLGMYDNTYGGTNYDDREALIAWMYDVSARWFAAYGRGGYGVEGEVVAPVGYKFQIGSLVYVSLTAARSSDGSSGLVAVGRVNKVEHMWGDRARVRVGIQMSTENFAELAPNARATITNASTLTLGTQIFSYSYSNPPFGAGWGAKDIHWFDVAQHGGSIKCKAWKVNDYAATVAVITVTASNVAANTLTVTEDLVALFTSGNVNITFADHSALTTGLSRLYAYVGNDPFQLFNGDDNKEYS